MRDFDLVLDKIAFAESVDSLAQSFQLSRQTDIAETVAFQNIQGFRGIIPSNQARPPRELTNIVKYVIDTSDGTLTTRDLIAEINRSVAGLGNRADGSDVPIEGGLNQVPERIGKFVKIYYPLFSNEEAKPYYRPGMNGILGSADATGTVNSNVSSPNKEHPGLSVIQIDNVLLTPSSKNSNAITLFMNGMPNLELQRAVPFINAQFFFGRSPTDGEGRLQSMSLLKFLEGATNQGMNVRGAGQGDSDSSANPFNAVRRLLVDANTVSGSIPGGSNESDYLATAGMEMFTAPQTLVNGNESYNSTLRTVPVLDKFRPFMTMKSLTIDIAPAAGLMSYKTAKLEFVLHDRSRLHEIADFIKPDLYGTTELSLEYGWSHPDVPVPNPGSTTTTSSALRYNPYGVLINGMRCKEKYGIRNMSAALDDSGQVNLTLDLYMKGGNEFASETIASNDLGTGDALRHIRELATAISNYERRYHFSSGGNASGGAGTSNAGSRHRTQEIRGTQILEAAGDWQGNIQLSHEMLQNLEDFKRSLRTGNGVGHEVVQRLKDDLDSLYRGRARNANSDSGPQAGGAIAQLTTTVQRKIEEKIRNITLNATDPFKDGNLENLTRREDLFSGRRRRTDTSTATTNNVNEPQFGDYGGVDHVSLGKLITCFVGVPLALTKKFDDVQFLFYPFNKYAGKANALNIAQFQVDVRFFIRQYTRFRTENAARAGNMTLGEFVHFIGTTILDDPAALSYGIHSLYRQVRNRAGQETSLEPSGNPVEFQTQMEQLLAQHTPDGTFKMPQIDFYIECLPGKVVRDGQTTASVTEQSILRIHIFDRQTTPFDTQAGLLAACRDDLLNSIGPMPQTGEEGNTAVRQSHEVAAQSIVDTARREGLIEAVASRDGSSSGGGYRITRGPESIKDFVMTTMPYIIYGIQGTMVRGSANLQTMQDSALSTVNMLRSFRGGPLEANGEQPGGLPLSVVPSELSLPAWGCPLIDFAQQYFIDFQTGTTWDNIYGVVGLSHKFSPGEFTSDIRFAPLDAYGKYNSLIEQVNLAANRLHNNMPPTSNV